MGQPRVLRHPRVGSRRGAQTEGGTAPTLHPPLMHAVLSMGGFCFVTPIWLGSCDSGTRLGEAERQTETAGERARCTGTAL